MVAGNVMPGVPAGTGIRRFRALVVQYQCGRSVGVPATGTPNRASGDTAGDDDGNKTGHRCPDHCNTAGSVCCATGSD